MKKNPKLFSPLGGEFSQDTSEVAEFQKVLEEYETFYHYQTRKWLQAIAFSLERRKKKPGNVNLVKDPFLHFKPSKLFMV